jgi:glyoxylase-like metal-dependent hydrolase (beta-lactamase superfamily II)
MNLNKIKGNSYFIDAPTNIGVYTFKSKQCILIDAGINNTAARKIDEVLIENGLSPKFIINTHSHSDHCGGDNYFNETYGGCNVYASQTEKMYMENPDLFPSVLYTSNPIKEILMLNKPVKVDYVIDYGLVKINDEKFEIIPLPGHSPEQIGFITSEKVCYTGDSVFSHKIIDKYSLPNLFNIEDSLKTLEYLKGIDADYFLISHSDGAVERDEFLKLIDLNIKNINDYIDEMLEILDQPQTKEELLQNIVLLNDLKLDFKEYHLSFSTISAFISYFYNKGLIDYSIEDGKLYYYKK